MLSLERLAPEEKPETTELKYLKPGVINAIECALQKVGPFGEVHLIIERGRLRFIRTITSESIDRVQG